MLPINSSPPLALATYACMALALAIIAPVSPTITVGSSVTFLILSAVGVSFVCFWSSTTGKGQGRVAYWLHMVGLVCWGLLVYEWGAYHLETIAYRGGEAVSFESYDANMLVLVSIWLMYMPCRYWIPIWLGFAGEVMRQGRNEMDKENSEARRGKEKEKDGKKW